MQQAREKVQFLHFTVPLGSAEALVMWGGKIRQFLIPYFLMNISAKNVSKSINVR